MPVEPTPPRNSMPRIMQMATIMRGRMHRFLESSQASFGDVFSIHIQRAPWTLVTHPDAVKEVFTAPPDVLHAGEGNVLLEPALGSNSLLLLDEERHMRQRKLLLPSFHGERLAAQRAAMERVAAEQVERFPKDAPFSLRDEAQAIALEIILEVVLGTEAGGEEHDRLAAPVKNILDWVASPVRLAVFSSLRNDHAIVRRMYRPVLAPLDEALYRLIADRRRAAGVDSRDDILSMLLGARDEAGNPMTDEELRDELVTLIVAGHETTSTSLAWAFERLTRDPEALGRLEEEARSDQKEWTQAVAWETLRLRPVLDFVTRKVVKPVEIAGYRFEPGQIVAPCIYLVHRRPDLYPDPSAFKPERWLGQKPGTYTWIPFGGGVRRCIGYSFAMTEMEVVLRAIARGTRLESVGGPEAATLRFITSSPARGGQVRVAAGARPASPAHQH